MRPSNRFTLLFLVLAFAITFAAAGFAQTPAAVATAKAAIQSGSPDMSSRAPVDVNHVALVSPTSVVIDGDNGGVFGATNFVKFNPNASASAASQSGNDDQFNITHRMPNTSTIDQLDTIATFSGAFVAQAGPDKDDDFRFTMAGNDPKLGGQTEFPAEILETSWQLLNPDGSVFMNVPFAPFEKLFLESPNFEPLDYRSGHNVEYGDAVHRAQFFNMMKNDWHTILIPNVVDRVTIQVPATVPAVIKGVTVQVPAYFTLTAADGSTVVLMLESLFESIFDQTEVQEIVAGNFRTNAMNMSLYPNTFLFTLNRANPQVPGGCCVLGFHTYFANFDGVFPQHRYISQYVSWISPGLFNGGFQDVTAMSHELAESFGNPFLSNPAPNWQFPGQPATSVDCQNNLEEGDPIEVLPTLLLPTSPTTTIEVKEKGFNFLYHPQNIPLLQWFEMGTSSSAIDGAFSFPDETTLPHSALPCPNGVG